MWPPNERRRRRQRAARNGRADPLPNRRQVRAWTNTSADATQAAVVVVLGVVEVAGVGARVAAVCVVVVVVVMTGEQPPRLCPGSR